MKSHGARKHSKFSASGAERYFNCPGSVALSEGIPDRDTPWSLEGTAAHEHLEKTVRLLVQGKIAHDPHGGFQAYSVPAANFITEIWRKLPDSDLLIEEKVSLEFVHPEMFGTLDYAVVDPFGMLHVLDYKFGKHLVSPVENLQMIFYALGLAHAHHWNFKRVKLWIIQPRARSFDGPLFWEMKTPELRGYVEDFERAVERVLSKPNEYREGAWCHFCKAKDLCPLKDTKRFEKAVDGFASIPLDEESFVFTD